MMPNRLRRMREMTWEEARWRTRELGATLLDRARFRIRQPEWPRTGDSPIASEIAARLQEGQSRCVIDPRLAHSVREEVASRWPGAVNDAAVRGDRLLVGLHDLLGYRG